MFMKFPPFVVQFRFVNAEMETKDLHHKKEIDLGKKQLTVKLHLPLLLALSCSSDLREEKSLLASCF